MTNSTKLQHYVQEELEWEPAIDASHIGVTATHSGVITLTGTVRTYAERVTAERAAKRVAGVRAVANDIEVEPVGSAKHTDTNLAQAVLQALESDIAVPHEKIRVRVDDGWVTLEGEVALQFQRAAAENAIRRLEGVRGVKNEVRLHTSSPTLGAAAPTVFGRIIKSNAGPKYGPMLVVPDAPDAGGDAFMITKFNALIEKSSKVAKANCKSKKIPFLREVTYDDGSKETATLTQKCKRKGGN